jgi:CubicO group peptidase (beta-lactamase class C family)
MAHQTTRQLTLVIIAICSSITATAQNKMAALNTYFSALSQNGDFNGNVLVAENGKIIYEKSFGYADYSVKRLNTATTSFPVASVTKTMTATAILQLQEKGKLSIHDRYSKYFRNFPYPTVTIRQLLSHTSRLPSSAFYRLLDSLQTAKRDTFFTNADVIPALIALKQPLSGRADEGGRSSFSYSNVNYYLLALLVEKLTGMTYGAYLDKYIFIPSGMENTSFSDFYFGMDKNLCREQRYRYLYDDAPERIDTAAEFASIFDVYNFKGHGDVVSTLKDLLKYDEALYNGTLLKESSLQQAYQPLVPGTAANSGYGLGWSIGQDSSKGKIVFHHGGGIGIEAMFVRNISRRQTIILFDNMKNPAFYTAMNALKILNGEKVAPRGKSVAKAYGKTLVKTGIPAARQLLQKLKKDTAHYNLSEYEMNLLAYQLMWSNRDSLAAEVFKTDLDLFPDSWNVYDSYGELLLKMGKTEEAIMMYKMSMVLNPENENGKRTLERLQKN